jgi:uncharacterized protein YggE
MQKRTLSLFLILVIFTFTSCNKIRQNDKPTLDNDKDPNTLTVSGSAQKYLDAVLIKIGITISHKDMSASNALKLNSQHSENVAEAIKGLGIPSKNITTTDFKIGSESDSVYNEGNRTYTQVFTGYKVDNALEVTISNLTLAGRLIDRAINAGAKEINYVRFDVPANQLKNVRDSLIKDASDVAINRAKLAAKAFNVTIDDVKSIIISSYSFPMISQSNVIQQNAALVEEKDSDDSPTIFGSNTNLASLDVSATFIVKKKANNNKS